MSKTFKPIITPELLNTIRSSRIGKNIETKTDLTVEDIIKNCCLEVPDEYIPGFYWSISWAPGVFTIKSEYLHQAQMLLKQAWLYDSENGFPSQFHGAVVQELTKFELGVEYDANRHQKRSAAKNKRTRIPALQTWIEDELIDNHGLQTKQLWARLPESSNQDGEGIFRDGDVVCCSWDTKKTIRLRAFYKLVKDVKRKIACSGVTCNGM